MVDGGSVSTRPQETIVNAFSVDVEDWYQASDFDAVVGGMAAWDGYESRVIRNTERILALLSDASVKGTFFVLSWNAERHPELVRRIAAAGHEIACHGYGHGLVYELTPEAFREDIRRAKHVLEDLAGGPVLGYRAPSFSITSRSLWALDILLECGFLYDSSFFPVRDSLYGPGATSRFPGVICRSDGRRLVEFPISTVRALGRNLPLGGGGYLRLLPYAYFSWGTRRVNRGEGRPTVVYVHPWEIDPEQPRIRTAGRRGFSTHYLGLRSTEGKLRNLLREFRFAPLQQVLDLAS